VTSTRSLIVNADDFGQSTGVNRGVIRAHELGIVTSASLMVRWDAAAEAAAYARAHPSLSVGLHLDLAEWVCRSGTWVTVYEVVPADDPAAVTAEVDRQLVAFRRLVGRDPTHLDSHQHVHREEPARSILVERARELGVPLRHFALSVRYCGEFYGQCADGTPLPDSISVARLLQLLARLPAGVTELACHPAETADLRSMYASERRTELRTLCDPLVRAAVVEHGIRLISFQDIAASG
jgi:chitin disaccharide deacetylase